MIIQLQCKKTATALRINSSPVSGEKQSPYQPALAKTVTLLNKGKTIRISMPARAHENRKKIRYHSLSGEDSLLKAETEQQPTWGFTPSFSPRRTYGNIRFLLEVMHKKVRAKTIENTFQRCNYKFDMSLEMNKGFRGRKVSQNSILSSTFQNKTKIKSLGPNYNKSKIDSPRQDQDIELLPSERNNKLGKIGNVEKQKSKQQNCHKPCTANASLNIYRKRFKETRKTKFNETEQASSSLILPEFFSQSAIIEPSKRSSIAE